MAPENHSPEEVDPILSTLFVLGVAAIPPASLLLAARTLAEDYSPAEPIPHQQDIDAWGEDDGGEDALRYNEPTPNSGTVFVENDSSAPDKGMYCSLGENYSHAPFCVEL